MYVFKSTYPIFPFLVTLQLDIEQELNKKRIDYLDIEQYKKNSRKFSHTEQHIIKIIKKNNFSHTEQHIIKKIKKKLLISYDKIL